MRPDDEGQSFRHYCRAMGNGLEEEKRKRRGGRSDNRGRHTNPFNRELYILRICQTIIRLSSARSVQSHPAPSRNLPKSHPRVAACCQFRGRHSTRMRAIQNFHPFHCRSDLRDFAGECIKRILATPSPIKFRFSVQSPFGSLCKSRGSRSY